jgi:hypothetical protein
VSTASRCSRPSKPAKNPLTCASPTDEKVRAFRLFTLLAFVPFLISCHHNGVWIFSAGGNSANPPSFIGATEAIPDITPLLQPTLLGDAATYTFFGIAGLFLGGETGLLTGASSARRTITRDPARKERVEKALGAFRIDALKKEIDMLEKQEWPGSGWGWGW